ADGEDAAGNGGAGDGDAVVESGAGESLTAGNAGGAHDVVPGPVGGSGAPGRISVGYARGQQSQPCCETQTGKASTDPSGGGDTCCRSHDQSPLVWWI